MGVFDHDIYGDENTQSTLRKVLQHWIDIVNERQSFEDFLNERPIAAPVYVETDRGHLFEKVPMTPAQESIFQSEFDPDYKPSYPIYIGMLNSCILNGRSPTQMLKIFSPMLKHVELNRGHWVTGWYDPETKEPVAIFSTKHENDAHLWIKAFEVSEKYRGHGIGRQVLQWAIDINREDLYLAVHPNNKVAIFMYEKIGFELDYFSQKEFKNGTRKNVVMIRRFRL